MFRLIFKERYKWTTAAVAEEPYQLHPLMLRMNNNGFNVILEHNDAKLTKRRRNKYFATLSKR